MGRVSPPSPCLAGRHPGGACHPHRCVRADRRPLQPLLPLRSLAVLIPACLGSIRIDYTPLRASVRSTARIALGHAIRPTLS